jgi:hypothetical protein
MFLLQFYINIHVFELLWLFLVSCLCAIVDFHGALSPWHRDGKF